MYPRILEPFVITLLTKLSVLPSRYEHMVQLPIIDNLMYNVQRQGKLAFYVRTPISFVHSLFAHLGFTDDTCRCSVQTS